MAYRRSRLAHLILYIFVTILCQPLGTPGADVPTTSVNGQITDSESGAPLGSASIRLEGPHHVYGDIADFKGGFSIERVPAGTYRLSVSFIGYKDHVVEALAVSDGPNASIMILLQPDLIYLNPISVTAVRRKERLTDTPAAVVVLDQKQIGIRPAFATSEHLAGLANVSVISTGLGRTRTAIRGFNGSGATGLLTLIDNRITNGFPVGAVKDVINDDIDRVEVVAGPASVLYGPSGQRGAVHTITKSPFDSKGTKVNINVGERQLFQTTVRHAAGLSDRVAYRVSAKYQRGEDWEVFDPAEPDSIVPGQQSPDGRIVFGPKTSNARDFTLEQYNVDTRLDMRLGDRTTAIFSGGFREVISGLTITGNSDLQFKNSKAWYAQTRVSRDALFAQAYVNVDGPLGKSRLLRSGDRIAGTTILFASQIQHGFALAGERQRFTYGIDVLLTRPDSDNTFTGRNDDDDDINEFGSYLQSETRLTRKLKLFLTGRIDEHNQFLDDAFSRQAALSFELIEDQNFRVTYGTAFRNQSPENFFLDFPIGPLGPLPYTLRVRSIPPGTGFTFARDPGGVGGLAMQSPFNPDGVEAYTPAEATRMWPAVVDLLSAQGTDLSDIPAPAATDVETSLRVFNSATPINPSSVQDIPPIAHERTTTIEWGYKGILNNNLLVTANVYQERNDGFAQGTRITPSIFLDEPSLSTYLSRFRSVEDADAIASAIAGIPVGSVTPEQGDPAAILFHNSFVKGIERTHWASRSGSTTTRATSGRSAATTPGSAPTFWKAGLGNRSTST